MPDTLDTSPEEAATPKEWLSVADAGARLGVSPKTIWRRAKAGKLTARKVAGASGGFVWEIAFDASGQPTDRPDKSERTPTGQSASIEAVSSVKSSDRPDKGTRPTDRTATGQTEEVTARLLAQLETENTFLRGVIEQLQRDGAETRQHLKRALELAPKQLTAGEALAPTKTAPEEAQNSETGKGSQGSSSGARTPATREEWASSSLGELADLLEQEMNR